MYSLIRVLCESHPPETVFMHSDRQLKLWIYDGSVWWLCVNNFSSLRVPWLYCIWFVSCTWKKRGIIHPCWGFVTIFFNWNLLQDLEKHFFLVFSVFWITTDVPFRLQALKTWSIIASANYLCQKKPVNLAAFLFSFFCPFSILFSRGGGLTKTWYLAWT